MRHCGFANIIRCSISRPLPLSAVSGTCDTFRKIGAISSSVRKSCFSSNTSSDYASYRIGSSSGGSSSKTRSNSLMKTKKVSNFLTGYKGDQSEDDTFTNEEIEQEQKLSGKFFSSCLLRSVLFSSYLLFYFIVLIKF